MIVAIMQPYFFPYIGYFQLMGAVDAFVYLDDVQYVDRSWMNRNRIRLGEGVKWISMPVLAAPRHANVNARFYMPHGEEALLRKIDEAYRRAPFYRDGRDLVASLLCQEERNVASFNIHLLDVISNGMGARPRTFRSSTLRQGVQRRGQDGILEICRQLGATRYVNPIGGVELYDEGAFERSSIELRFLRTTAPSATIGGQGIHLSIIDLLMSQGMAACSALLRKRDLLSASEAKGLA